MPLNILFISHKHPPSLGGMETQSYYIAANLQKKHNLKKIVYEGKGSKVKFFLSLKTKIKQILKQEKIDLIHLNDGLMAFILNWLPAYTDIPIFITFLGLDLIFKSSFYQRRISNFIKPHCYAICVSKATYDIALKKGFDQNIRTDYARVSGHR